MIIRARCNVSFGLCCGNHPSSALGLDHFSNKTVLFSSGLVTRAAGLHLGNFILMLEPVLGAATLHIRPCILFYNRVLASIGRGKKCRLNDSHIKMVENLGQEGK